MSLKYGDLILKGNSSVFFEDGDTNTIELKAPASVAANLTFTLPATITASGVLSTDGSGVMSSALLVNANVAAGAAIAESKLALSQSTADLAQRDLDNLTVSGLAAQSLLVGSSATQVTNLAVGSNGQVLSVVSGAVAWAAPTSTVNKFTATWVNADTATKAITHSLGSTDLVVEIYDIDSGETIGVDTVTRTSSNVLTVVASEAPDSGGSGWKVVILAA